MASQVSSLVSPQPPTQRLVARGTNADDSFCVLVMRSGYWAYTVQVSDGATGTHAELRSALCPQDACQGGALQGGGNMSTTAQLASQCAYPRVASPLCGECAEGFIPQGNRCAPCPGV